MFLVIKKPLTPNTIWDVENQCPLCKFTNGKLETNDVELVKKLKERGYEVTGEADETNVPDCEDNGQEETESTSDEVTGEADEKTTRRRNRKS